MFHRDQGAADNWGEVRKLTASDAEAGDKFGIGVAVDGDTALIGAFEEDAGGGQAGAAYVVQQPPEVDGDGYGDPQQALHLAPMNTDVTTDNCTSVANPTQTNTDGNYIDNLPPYGVDDKTWIDSDAAGDACDLDDDNDGLSDADEASGAACAGTATNPLLADTDGDRALDRAECAIGTNATDGGTDPGDRPTITQCVNEISVTSAADTDGDKIKDYIEFCYYGSDHTLTDTDGDKALDGAQDGCEVASLNVDRIVSSGDQGMLAAGISGAAAYQPNIDLDKSGVLNSGDQGLMASFIVPGGQCPG